MLSITLLAFVHHLRKAGTHKSLITIILKKMDLTKTIQKIKENGIEQVNSGEAKDFQEFFEKVIKKQFSNTEAIKAVHRTLIEYINSDKAVYVLRLYGSASTDKYHLLRRGFLTQYPQDKKVVFCDNTFAMPFASIKLDGETYTADELLKYMSNPNLQCGFGSTKEERELAFYQYDGKSRINLNSAGWYLAHIEPVGYNYIDGKSLSKVFPRPDRKQWEESENKVRISTAPLTDEELGMLKAHFLRLVHPLNSFLVPKRSMVAYEEGNNIGEESALINIVRDFIKKEFEAEYSELENLMQVSSKDITTSPKASGRIIWSNSPSKLKTNKSVKKTRLKIETTYIRHSQIDTYNIDMEESLERTLQSVGKGAFLKLYPIVIKNPNATIEDICTIYPEYGNYSPDSQKSRLSCTRSIIKKDLGTEALEIIKNSSQIKEEERQLANQLLQQLKKSLFIMR